MASRAFESAVRSLFAPRMATLGFVRHGVRYIRPCPPFGVQGVMLEQSKWNGGGFCAFTLQLTRSLKLDLSRDRLVERARADKRLFDTHAADRIQRSVWIGPLTEVKADYWYDYPADDARGIGVALNEALGDLERYGLPWLARGFDLPFRRADPTRRQAHEARFQAHLAALHAQGEPGAP